MVEIGSSHRRGGTSPSLFAEEEERRRRAQELASRNGAPAIHMLAFIILVIFP